MKKTKSAVYIKDLKGMRTATLSDAMKFKDKDEAEKQLCGMYHNGYILAKNWEVSCPKKKPSLKKEKK